MISVELKPEISLLMKKLLLSIRHNQKLLMLPKSLSCLSPVYYLEIIFQNGEKREQHAYTVDIWPKVTLKAVIMKANYGALNVMCLFVALRHVLIVLKISMLQLNKFIKLRAFFSKHRANYLGIFSKILC